jgi:hypothetical protein
MIKYRYLSKINIQNIVSVTEEYHMNWLQHIYRIKTNRILKQEWESLRFSKKR